ncbi:hypothetical protein [Tenacibaculum amylolyticum]|uniref:hypothetical protein n=1 Tax=Tenacibaculum amylolyticum TaxID=104269 RepID=UPI00389462CC
MRYFTSDEQTAISNALSPLETSLTSKLANLSPDERRQFGSINEQNKLVINKVKEYRENQPLLSSPDIDWDEFTRDFNSRTFIEMLFQRLNNLNTGLKNAKILHDWDNYQDTLTDYNYTKYKNGTAATGYEAKQNDLAQFFGKKTSTTNTTVSTPEEQTR